ncbi:erythromycin resistance leader peptide [Staphylococcus aureus]
MGIFSIFVISTVHYCKWRL